MKIRYAEMKDADDIVRLGKMFAMEYPKYASHEVVEEDALQTVQTLLNNSMACILVLDHEVDGLIGVMIAVVVPSFYNRSILIANEVLLYVSPEHRNVNNAKALITNMETWAKSVNAYNMDLAYPVEHDLHRFYNRLGYGEHEVHCMKAL